jgi:sugar phosphate isomerase/epimerase
MKLGCSSWSYHAALRDGRIDLREWLRICAEDLELDGVELVDLHVPTTDALYLRDLKKLCTDLHLTLAGIAVSNDFGADEHRGMEIEKVMRWCDIAAYLGAPVVRVFAGWLPHRASAPETGRIVGLFRKVFGEKLPDRRRAWSDVTWALRQCADYAAERGVVVAVQNNRADGIVGTPQQLWQCVRDVGSPWLRVCLDPGDMLDRTGIEMSLPYAVQAHAKLRDVRDDGADASIHWPEILRMLQLGRYRGFLMLDYEGGEGPETAVPRAARHMRGLLHLLARQELLRTAEGSPGRAEDGARRDDEPRYAVVEQAAAVAAEAAAAR